MTQQIKVGVLYHIFYEDIIEHIVEELSGLSKLQVTYFFNISSTTPNQFDIKEKLREYFPGSVITISSNKGKDIGGKLLLLNACLQTDFEPDWIIFLHDKKSLHAVNAQTWKNNLLKIIAKEQVEKIVRLILNNPDCGIIAANNYVLTETKKAGAFVGNNGILLSQLSEEYKINCNQYDYVAGTMFWAKATAVFRFFKKNDPLKIRQTLEEGNVLDNFTGTNTHSWERLLSWLVTSQGLNIKTV